MLSLEEGSTDYHHCDTIWCLETSPATLLLLPVLQLRQQICGTHHFSTYVSVCFHVMFFGGHFRNKEVLCRHILRTRRTSEFQS